MTPRVPPADSQMIVSGFLNGDPESVGILDKWIDGVLHREFFSLQSEWEDLRQEVRVRLFSCLTNNRFNGLSTFRTFVHRVTRNVGIDCARKAYRRRERTGSVNAEESTGNDPVDALTAQNLVARILEHSSARDRAVVDLVFVQHLSYAEVAEKMGISVSAMKVVVFRCKARLLKRLRQLDSLRGGER